MAVSRMVGEYFDGGSGGQPVSTGSYFTATPGGQMTGVGRSPDGLGRLGDLFPIAKDLSALRPQRPAPRLAGLGMGLGMGPLGQEPGELPPEELTASPVVPPRIAIAAALIGIAIRGAAGYYIGRAVAPSADKEKKYAMWGIPNAIVFGTLGLGVQAAIGFNKRR